MDKPQNPYKPGTAIYRLMDEDWSAMTRYEIAVNLGTSPKTIACALSKIRDDTGYWPPHIDGRKLRWQKQKEK